jgi:hypothetical protein
MKLLALSYPMLFVLESFNVTYSRRWFFCYYARCLPNGGVDFIRDAALPSTEKFSIDTTKSFLMASTCPWGRVSRNKLASESEPSAGVNEYHPSSSRTMQSLPQSLELRTQRHSVQTRQVVRTEDDLEKCSELTWQHTVSSKDSCATCNENYTRALQIWKPEWGAIPGDMRILATSDGMPIPQNLSLERSAVSFWLLLEPMRQMHDVDGDWEFCLRMRCYRRSSAPRKLCKVLPIRLDYQVDCFS